MFWDKRSQVADKRMKIIVADNQPPVRKALKRFLEQFDKFKVAGEAGELTGLLVLGQAYHPEVALVDWGLLGPSPEISLSALLRISPRTKIVIMSGDPDIGKEAISAGASGFVFKAEPPERLVKMIHETVLPP